MSKAFDRAPHQRLLEVLFECGLGGTALQWFRSYLSERRQIVTAPLTAPGNSFWRVERGVPQGSVLGPVLFTLYLRSLPSLLKTASCLMYADDIYLYVCGSDADSATAALQEEVGLVHKFLLEYSLELNLTKTQFLLVHGASRRLARPVAPLMVAGKTVPPADKVQYLGLIIDECLSFTDQVSNVVSKVSAKLQVFCRSRSKFTVAAKRTFYLSFIQSVFEYGSTAYVHSLHTADYDRLLRISKRAVRLVFGYPSSAHGAPIFTRYKFTPLSVRFSLKLFILVNRCLIENASLLPDCSFINMWLVRGTKREQAVAGTWNKGCDFLKAIAQIEPKEDLRGPQAQFLCCLYRDALILFPVHTSAVPPNLWSLIFRIFCCRSFIDLAKKIQGKTFPGYQHDHQCNYMYWAEQLDQRPLR